MRKYLMLLVVIAVLVSTAFTVETTEEPKKLISLDFPDTPLSTVLDVLSLKTGQKFITDTDLSRKRIVLNLKGVTAEQALNALLDTYNLYYVRQENSDIYVIKNKTNEATATTVSKIIFLNYSTAKDLEGTLKSKLTRYGTISSEARTNSVIVNDIADNIDKIEALIKVLDIPTLQVSLEAKIVDVRLDSGLQTGVHLTNLYRTNYSQNPLSLQNGALPPYEPTVKYSQNLSGALATSGRLTMSVLSNGYDIEGYIEALKSDTDAKLLANPRLLVMSNQEANIEIIDQIPYEQYTISDGVTTITTLFKDVGIRMKVKPQINRDGTIVLNVSPEQSFRTTESIGKVPVINTTRSNTTFILRNGETAVLGGLIRESDVKTEYKVPLLGDIPILGFLFKNSNKTKQRTELTIFITAHVIQL